MDILNMTALEIGAAIKKKEITVVDAVKAVLDSIAKTDWAVNAYITVNGEEALKKAEEVQAKIDAGEERLLKSIGFKLHGEEYFADMNGMFDGHCDGHTVEL